MFFERSPRAGFNYAGYYDCRLCFIALRGYCAVPFWGAATLLLPSKVPSRKLQVEQRLEAQLLYYFSQSRRRNLG